MAPRKPTSKAATDEDPSDLILTYLVAQNRPYSATEISSNLHNKVTKAKTDKILKELHERGEIAGHTSGKSTVYWCLQVCVLTTSHMILCFILYSVGAWGRRGRQRGCKE